MILKIAYYDFVVCSAYLINVSIQTTILRQPNLFKVLDDTGDKIQPWGTPVMSANVTNSVNRSHITS